MRRYPFLFALFVTAALAAQVDVSVRADSLQLRVGDPLRVELTATAPAGTTLRGAATQLIGEAENLELLRESDWDSTTAAGATTYRKNLLVTAWDSGQFWFPAVPVEFSDGTRRATNQLPLTVALMPADTTELAPIYGILDEPLRFSDFLPYILGTLGVLLLIGGVVRYARSRRAAERPEPVAAPRPPHEIALERLAILRRERPWERGDLKQYHTDLTYAIRAYLEDQFNEPALESTTRQLSDLLEHDPAFPNDWLPRLREILQVADLVKFAKATPPADYHERFLTDAERLVHETKPAADAVE